MKPFIAALAACATMFLIAVVPNAAGADKIAPGTVTVGGDHAPPPPNTGNARLRTLTEWYEAVGTVRPRTESRIEAQVTAQVVDVKARPGSKVARGQVLVLLDNRQFMSRLDQAQQGLKSAEAGKKQAQQATAAAEAALTRATAAYERTKTYFASQAATAQDMENAEAAYRQAQAELERAKEAAAGAEAGIRRAREVVREADIALGYTRITAPEDGEVLKRLVEPGDLALPGKPLMVLQTEGKHRLEAHLREGLITRVHPGMKLKVDIDTLDTVVEATVEEIIPYADPDTRTFLVKAGLPVIDGVYPGMFGKLRVPVDTRQVITIPAAALRKVGQLELVTVRENNRWVERLIKIGRRFGGELEVLSGLAGDETIGIY